MATVLLSIACVVLAAYALNQKLAALTLSAYTHKKGIPPSDDDLKECGAYVIGRLLGKKPRL